MAILVRPLDSKPQVNRKLIAGLFLCTGIVSLVLWLVNRPVIKAGAGLKITYTIKPQKLMVATDTSRSTTQLLSQIAQKLSQAQGEYGLYVYRLDQKVGYGLNETAILPAASIMKVPIMEASFNNLKLDDVYTLVDEDKRSGSGPIEFLDPGTQLTIQQLLEEMGKKSDNSAPVILTKLLPVGSMNKTLKSLGMSNSNFIDNTTTAYDVARMWVSVYEENNQLMWSFLQDSIYEDRIPKGLPENQKIIHKVGSDDTVWADGGIVLADHPLVISILNKDVNLDEAKKLIPEITKMIWDYESTRPPQKS